MTHMTVTSGSREPEVVPAATTRRPTDEDHSAVDRQRGFNNLHFNLHPSRAQGQAASVSQFADVANDMPLQTSYLMSHELPPQLPPLPVSPRWDASGSSNNFIHQKSKAALSVPSAYDHLRPTPDSPARPCPPPDFPMGPGEPFPRTITPPASESEPRASSDTMRSQNFSRPRNPSLKHPALESSKAKQNITPAPFTPPPDIPDFPPSMSQAQSRPRGQSSASSSVHSFSTAPPPLVTDSFDPGRSKLRQATNVSVTPRPPPFPLHPTRGDSGVSGAGSGHTRDMTPWTDESRSSYRSQGSSAQGTWTTDRSRSSVMTKDSSVHSEYAGPDEPSIEDVMGMYEKGFHDESSPEELDEQDVTDDKKRETVMNKRNTRILEALEKPLTASREQSSTLAPPDLGHAVRDSSDFFRGEQDSSTQEDSPPPDYERDGEEVKRDSAKSLHEMPPVSPLRQASSSTTTTSPATAVSIIEPEDPNSRDRYGFKKQNQYITREKYDTWNAEYSEYLDRRKKKWVAFQKENGLMTDQPMRFPPPSAKTKRFIRKGIPPGWRGAAWFYYAGGPAILAKHSGVYDDMLKRRARTTDVEAIERDLHRTFPDNVNFKPAEVASMPNTEPGHNSQRTSSDSETDKPEPEMISSLRRVLHAFAIYNPRIGYCQSLNFLAGLLLLFMETEEQSFWLLNVITRVYLPGTHETSLEGSRVDLGVLMAAIRESMPAVWARIGEDTEGDPNAARPSGGGNPLRKAKSRRFRHVASKSADRLPPITLCMTAWFMSCFIGTLPIETTLRVWDVFFYEGSKTLFRIALAIFKVGEAEIKAIADPMEMFSIVQAMPRRLIDANALMDATFKRRNGFGHLSQDTIESQRRERRNKVHAQQEKAEADMGSSSNVTEAADEKPRRKGTLFRRKKKDA